jgi:3-oxoacyl-[acyl-carrier-protein] synthase III
LGIRIASIALAIPAEFQTAAQLAPWIGRDEQWIVEHTGVVQRYVADDATSPAELAAEAARQVIASSGAPDLLIYAGALTQQLVPDTSVFVLRELCLDGIPGFTVNQTCLSFVTALQVAEGLLRCGRYQRILICSAELATRGRNFDEPESAALLGDGAAAAMLELTEDSDSEVLGIAIECWPEGANLCEVKAGLHPRPQPNPSHQELYSFQMQGPQLYRFVRPRLGKFIMRLLRQCDCDLDDVRWVVPHQASGPGLRLLEQVGFSNDCIVNVVGQYGNCVAASIPMALAVAVGDQRIQRGDLLLLVGTAAGVSLGAALLRW